MRRICVIGVDSAEWHWIGVLVKECVELHPFGWNLQHLVVVIALLLLSMSNTFTVGFLAHSTVIFQSGFMHQWCTNSSLTFLHDATYHLTFHFPPWLPFSTHTSKWGRILSSTDSVHIWNPPSRNDRGIRSVAKGYPVLFLLEELLVTHRWQQYSSLLSSKLSGALRESEPCRIFIQGLLL